MKGLINKVVWIKPSWDSESGVVSITRCYVGSTKVNNTNQVCLCQQGRNETQWEQSLDCFWYNRAEDPESNTSMVPIERKACKMIHAFKYISIGENDVIGSLKLGNIKNAIIDIDEDYYGVESGVGNFIRKGVAESDQKDFDYYLGFLYCPRSIKDERMINDQLLGIFNRLLHLIEDNDEENVGRLLQEEIVRSTQQYMCHTQHQEEIIKELIKHILSLSTNETKSLSNLKFCSYSRPHSHVIKSLYGKSDKSFGICHGTIFPNDTLNQIYVGSIDDVIKRGLRMRNILTHLIFHVELKLVTIARSLRDGYTPRDQQRLIERTVLKNLNESLLKFGKRPKVIYDEQRFGREGW